MNIAQPVIAIASTDGDPRNQTSWSGTSSNIVKALESLGISVIGINAKVRKPWGRLLLILHRASGLGRDYKGGPFFRSYSAKRVQRQSRALGCTKILHMGHLALPMPKLDPQVEHYLLCDTTMDLWTRHSTKDAQRCTPKMKQIVERLDHESYAQIKHFFSFSEYVRDNLIKAYGIDPNKITVVGAGRGSLQPFTEEKDYRNGHILFVAKGRFEDKGGLILLEAFKIAQRKSPHLKLIIVGQDEYTHLNGSIPNLTVKGYIPWGEELQNLFNTASLFAMPALNEPWGLVYLEALATKTPILGLNRNALPEITRDGQYGFLVNEPTPERVADAILQAFSNPENLSKMGVRGQKYCVEKFSWNQVATKIAKLMLDSQHIG